MISAEITENGQVLKLENLTVQGVTEAKFQAKSLLEKIEEYEEKINLQEEIDTDPDTWPEDNYTNR